MNFQLYTDTAVLIFMPSLTMVTNSAFNMLLADMFTATNTFLLDNFKVGHTCKYIVLGIIAMYM